MSSTSKSSTPTSAELHAGGTNRQHIHFQQYRRFQHVNSVNDLLFHVNFVSDCFNFAMLLDDTNEVFWKGGLGGILLEDASI